MFYEKSLIAPVFALAKRVYEEVDRQKIYLSAIELTQKTDASIVLLGERMFKLRGQDTFFKDPSLSVLVNKIREDRKIVSDYTGQKRSYLLNSYIYISKLFNNTF